MDSSLSWHSTKATLYKIDRLEKDDNIVIKILFANGKIAEVIFSTLLSLIKRPTLLATTQDMWEKSCIFVMSGIGIPLGVSNILFF